MDFPTVLWIVFGLLLIFFFVVSFLSAKTWQVVHVILVVLVFFSVSAALFLGAAALKTHQAWRNECDKFTASLDKAKQEGEWLEYGKRLDPAEQTTDSIRSVKAEHGRVVLDRGRVWRGCRITSAGADGSAVVAPPQQPPGGAGTDTDQTVKNNLEEKMIVYAFTEVVSEDTRSFSRDKQHMVPQTYLGEFQVTRSDETTATLSPRLPLTAKQKAELAKAQSSPAIGCVLYEVMPIDAHQVFEGLDAEELASLFPKNRFPAGRYQAMLHEYEHDGQPADKDHDPADRIWKKVRFKKAMTIENKQAVQVDPPGGPVGASDRDFDDEGRAIPQRIRQAEIPAKPQSNPNGSPQFYDPLDFKNWPQDVKDKYEYGKWTEFDEGDVAVFDAETADRWIDDGACEEIELVYVRRLRDYASHFDEIQRRMNELADLKRQIETDTQSVVVDISAAKVQQTDYQGEQAKLEADLAGFKAENAAVSAHLSALEDQMTELRQNLSRFYKANNLLAAELARLQQQMADRINRKTSRAMAQSRSQPAVP